MIEFAAFRGAVAQLGERRVRNAKVEGSIPFRSTTSFLSLAACMIDVEHSRTIDLPAAVVWEEVRHFDRVLLWVPGGERSRISVRGSGVGAVRDIHLATQGYVQHRLVAYDDDARSFSYELSAGQPIGMQRYVVVATVSPLDDTHCRLRWAGRMTADASLDDAVVGRALEVALGNMTTGIIARLKGERPQFIEQPNEAWQLERRPQS